MVTRIDRLARSIADLAGIVGELTEKGVTLRATEQPIDTSTAAGRCLRANQSSALRERLAGSRERIMRSRVAQLEGQAGAGMHHRRAPGMDGGDDLL